MRTVIVRLFEPAPDAGAVPIRGVVEDVRTGVTWPFRSQPELLAAITHCLGGRSLGGSMPPPVPPEKPVGPD